MSTYTVAWEDQPAADCGGGALAIGNFDGVHRGHLALLAALRDQARARNVPAVALTFDPHPLLILRPEQFQPVLTTTADRAALLRENGADHVLILRTTPELLHLTAEEFFEEVIRRRLDARVLVEGTNFGFGRGREGDVQTLARLSQRAGIDPPVLVPPFLVAGRPVSSSRVRAALLRGDVREAAGLLDRPYRIRGTVGAGQHRGRTLGFPTANLEQVPTLVPGDGVYAVRAAAQDRTWPGAANVGPNPTFGEQTRKVEVHLLDFQGELYGVPLAVDFVDRIRDTRPFAGPAQLVAQLRQDVDRAREILGKAN
jgi:riboflavin kinase/FMN adenylyltransferase